MKTYLSGKITGLPFDEVERKFNTAEKDVAITGSIVVNPLYLNDNHDKSWKSYMQQCIRALIKCDCIYMLSDWWMSKGAIAEHRIALDLGLIVIYQKIR